MLALIRFFSSVTYRLGQLAILGTLCIVTFEVVARYVFGSPTQSSLEITEYFLVAMGVLPLAAIYTTKGHVGVDIFTNMMPKVWRDTCMFLSIAMTAIFSFLVFWFGLDLAVQAFSSGTTSSSLLAFPMWLAYSTIPLGFFALALESVSEFISQLAMLKGEQ